MSKLTTGADRATAVFPGAKERTGAELLVREMNKAGMANMQAFIASAPGNRLNSGQESNSSLNSESECGNREGFWAEVRFLIQAIRTSPTVDSIYWRSDPKLSRGRDRQRISTNGAVIMLEVRDIADAEGFRWYYVFYGGESGWIPGHIPQPAPNIQVFEEAVDNERVVSRSSNAVVTIHPRPGESAITDPPNENGGITEIGGIKGLENGAIVTLSQEACPHCNNPDCGKRINHNGRWWVRIDSWREKRIIEILTLGVNYHRTGTPDDIDCLGRSQFNDRWRPRFTRIAGTPRSPEAYNLIINQFDVANRYTRHPTTRQTYCSFFVQDVSSAMGAPLSPNANSMGDFLARANRDPNSGWRNVTPREAQSRANEGYLTVASEIYRVAHPLIEGVIIEGTGHVAIVRPEMGPDFLFQDRLGGIPVLANAGSSNFSYGSARNAWSTERIVLHNGEEIIIDGKPFTINPFANILYYVYEGS